MRRILLLFVISGLCLFGCSKDDPIVIITPEKDITAEFPDANFRAWILAYICPAGATTIHVEDVKEVTSVKFLHSVGIESFVGLHWFENLVELHLTYFRVKTWHPLNNIPNWVDPRPGSTWYYSGNEVRVEYYN